jgi:lipoprotein-anchoring transpeptidase ErfK/SrfK
LVVAVDAGSGPNTAVAQARLTELGFWNGVSDGLYGFTTYQAVTAFQKYVSLPPTGRIDRETADRLNAQTERAHGESQSRTWVEVDKDKQLLFIVVEGETLWTFNTSTGSEVTHSVAGRSVTPDGLWTVSRERPNGWWRSDLGEIYRPKYFRGAVAIHGMNSVPNRPASHGCVRVSTAAMDFIWDNDLVPIGARVWVHD